MNKTLLHIGNWMYEHCYPMYYPLYALYKSISDKNERDLLKKLIKPGMTIVDIGANIGIYTCYLSKLTGLNGSVHAFEPAPLNFKKLSKNVAHLTNVVSNHAAVGSHNGSIDLYLSKKLNVDHHTFDNGENREKINVPVFTLDNYFMSGQRIDLLKIDVQGYELNVLKGAKRILNENPDIKILMEFWPYGLIKAATQPKEVISFIHSFGFKIKTTDLRNQQLDTLTQESNDIHKYVNLIIHK